MMKKKQDGWILLSILIVLFLSAIAIPRLIKRGDDAVNDVTVSAMANDFVLLRNTIIKEFSHVGSYCGLSNLYLIEKGMLPKAFTVSQNEATNGYKINYRYGEIRTGYINLSGHLPPSGDPCKGFYIKYTKVPNEVSRRLMRALHPYFDLVKWGGHYVKRYSDYDENEGNLEYEERKKAGGARTGANFTYYGI